MAGSVDIRALCAGWINAATSGGGISLGAASEAFRLHRSGVAFHELDYEDIRAAAVGLTETLLLPGFNTIIDLDHKLFWSWAGELLLGTNAPLSGQSRDVSRLGSVAIRAALAGTRQSTPEAWNQSRTASEVLDPNSRELLSHSHEVLPYVAFPLFEALSRRACAQYVDLRGIVLAPFGGYKVGRRCSNVGAVLKLLVGTVASADLRSDLTELLEHVAAFDPAGGAQTVSNGCAVIFDWRNSSLHGEASLPTIGGTVLSLALLIGLDELRADYPTHQAAALTRAQREVQTAALMARWTPSPWSYYPPFP